MERAARDFHRKATEAVVVIVTNSTASQVRGPEAPQPAAAVARARQEVAVPGKPTPAASEPKAAEPPDASAVNAAVLRLNEYLQQERRTLQFSVDQDSGHVVITVTDSDTDQVIRQIPSEEVLALMRHLSEGPRGAMHQGVLLSEKA
jgi:flagellar protein FlaG